MIIENIVQMWNPILYEKTNNIIDFNNDLKKNIRDMIDTMREKKLIWISANQIWLPKSIFLTEIRKTKTRDEKDTDWLRVFINPEIVFYSKKKNIWYEWCWSVAHTDFFAEVSRSESVIIKAVDENWKKFEFNASWLLARVIQHEYDHLNWVLFIEKIADTKTCMSWDEYRKRVILWKK